MAWTVVELVGNCYVRGPLTRIATLAMPVLRGPGERQLSKSFQMSLFGCGKVLNEGFFHILSSPAHTFHGHIKIGGTHILSSLPERDAPNDIYRFI